MPILFEAPQPFDQRTSEYYGRALADGMGGGGRGSGGGGFGGGGNAGYDIQAAINNRDANAIQSLQFQAQLNDRAAAATFGAEAQANDQRARFEFQAQLQQMELTQQEKIRLQRMKNAVGAVNTDPTLTAEEKRDMILQLQTGINPMEQRLAAQKLAQEKMLKEAMIDDIRMRTAMREESAKYAAMTLDEKMKNVPHTQALAQITDEINTAFPGLPPEKVAEMAKAEAIKRGQFTQFLIGPDGKPIQVTGPGAEGAGHFEKGGGRSSSSGTGAGGGEKPPKELTDVDVLRQAKARLETEGATPDDKDWNEKLKRTAEAIKGENKGRREQAQSGGKPQQLPEQDKRAVLEKTATKVQEYANRSDLPPDIREAMVAIGRQFYKFFEKYGPYENFPPAVKTQFDTLDKRLTELEKQAGQQAPAAPPTDRDLGVPRYERGTMGSVAPARPRGRPYINDKGEIAYK